MINKIHTKLYFLSLSILIVLIDQFTKYLMSQNNKLFINKDFLLFKLDFVKNYGAAFNIFSGSRVFLSLISIIFSLLLIYLIFRKNTFNLFDLYSYSFILGGTIGNGIDRIYKGFVVEEEDLKTIFLGFKPNSINYQLQIINDLKNEFKKNNFSEKIDNIDLTDPNKPKIKVFKP